MLFHLGLPRALVAVFQHLDNSLFEKEACKWKTGLEEGKAPIHDNVIYVPGSSHAEIVQVCEPMKPLSWPRFIRTLGCGSCDHGWSLHRSDLS